MAFRHLLGFLAREVFPPLDRHIHVGGLDLQSVAAALLLLGGDNGRATAGERVDTKPIQLVRALGLFGSSVSRTR